MDSASTLIIKKNHSFLYLPIKSIPHFPYNVFDHLYFFLWRRQWHPTPVLLPGKFHGWRSLVGCSPWGR